MQDMNIFSNAQIAKKILNINHDKFDYFLEFCAKKVTERILDFCNIETIPERLNTLVQDFVIEQYTLNKDGVGEGKQEVTSTSDSGQSVSFKTIGGASSMSANVEEFINKNQTTLVQYRKLRWK